MGSKLSLEQDGSQVYARLHEDDKRDVVYPVPAYLVPMFNAIIRVMEGKNGSHAS